MQKKLFSATFFPLCISLLLSVPVTILSMERPDKALPLTTFEHLDKYSVYRVASSLEDGQDVYALGSTNKRNVKLLLHNSDFLNILIQKRMVPCFKLEDTRIFQNLNQEFRTILFSDEDWDTRKNKLEQLHQFANGMIQLDTCAHSKNAHNYICIIPLLEACVQGNWQIAQFLLNKGASSAINPSKLCTAKKNNFSSITEATLKAINSLTLLPRVKMIEASNMPIIPDTLHHAILLMCDNNDSLANDYRAVEHLIRLGAPIDTEMTESYATPLQLFVFNKNTKARSQSYKKSMLTLLIDSQADISKKNAWGENAITLADTDLKLTMRQIHEDHVEFLKTQQHTNSAQTNK